MGYSDIEIPDEKSPEDYTYHERRAELLQVILEAGHPDRINRTEFGEHYDVDHSTISRDIQALRDDIREDLTDDAEFVSGVVFRKALREKVEDKDWMDAIEILESWNGWMFDSGIQEEAADKIEIEGNPGDAYMEALRNQVDEDEEDDA